ncbi:MAG: twin-arginine translocase TatA/TatE family subunit, partial [Maricaulaceae bacterium]
MAPGIWQIVLVLVVALLLFGGRGRLAAIMGDVGKGVRSFRSGLKQDEVAPASAPEAAPPPQLAAPPTPHAPAVPPPAHNAD